MNKVIIISIISAAVLCGCNKNQQSGITSQNPLCAGITQKIDNARSTNTNPGNGVTTAAERAYLYKEYNHLGCHRASDNTFRNPYESLPMNDMANSYGGVKAPRH